MYRLEKAAGIQACALAARLCADKDLQLGKESCERTNDSSGPDSCAIELACASPIKYDATTDGEAWVLRSGSARCDGSAESKSFQCRCSNGALTSNYQLLADSGELACGTLADFCMSGETPIFDGEEACVPSFSNADSAGCDRTDYCGPQMPLTGDVSLVELREVTAGCMASPGGGSDCYCFDRDSEFLFRQSTAPVAATCKSSIPNCDPSAVIEPTGPASCGPLAIELNDVSMCTAGTSCLQEVTVDNRSILAKSNLNLMCRREGTGKPWWCSCASGPESSRLELGAPGVSASEACRQGAAACLQQLGLHLGPYRDLVMPEDPLR